MSKGLIGVAAASLMLAVSVGGFSPTEVEASVIQLHTRNSSSGPLGSADAYKTTVEALTQVTPTSGYCDATLAVYDNISNHATCGGLLRDIAFHFQVTFGVSATQAGDWGLRIGPDFGRGGALFLDGVALDFKTTDLWWEGSYNNLNQVFIQNVNPLSPGNHVLDVYGLEGCCDGAQQGQFRIAQGSWTTFSANDGLNRVAEPASLALLGLGLAGLCWRRRKGHAVTERLSKNSPLPSGEGLGVRGLFQRLSGPQAV